MNDKGSMKPVAIGAAVAAAVIAAFILGRVGPFEQEGPAERVGEQIDQAAEELKEGVENMEENAGSSGN